MEIPPLEIEPSIESPYQNDVIRVLEEIGALEKGHYVYVSGDHGPDYIDKDKLLARPLVTNKLCGYLAQEFIEDGIEVVIGPAMGGVNLAYATAWNLIDLTGQPVFSVFTERETKMSPHQLRSSYREYVSGRRTLIVEDNTTTGGSIEQLANLVREAGGDLAGVGVICNRGNVQKHQVGNPKKFISLAYTPMPNWAADKCPLCARGVPINTNLGKGKVFLDALGRS